MCVHLIDQTDFPGDVSARRRFVAIVALMGVEQKVDALGIGWIVRGCGEFEAGRLPRRRVALKLADIGVSELAEPLGCQRSCRAAISDQHDGLAGIEPEAIEAGRMDQRAPSMWPAR